MRPQTATRLRHDRAAFVLAIALVIVGDVPLFAQQSLGGMAGSPFRMGFGARSIGLGQSMGAIRSDEGVGGMNPSLLPFLNRTSLELGVFSLTLDRSLMYASYTAKLPPSAGLAFTFTGARATDIQGRDRNGLPTEMYATGEYAFGLMFGLQPSPRFTIGAGAKLLYSSLLPELTQSTVGLDFGASYLVSEPLTVSLILRDVNSKYRWETVPLYGRDGNTTVDMFPKRFIVAAAYEMEDPAAVLDAEVESIEDVILLRAGLELQIHPMVHVRAGVDAIDVEEQIGTRTSFGISLSETGITWNPSFDYAFVIEPYAPTGAHVLSIRLRIKE